MNDAQHAALSAYVAQLQEALNLRDWEAEIDRGKSDSDTYASISVFEVEDHFILRICDGFWGYPATEQREWLVHEVLHVHTERLCNLFEALIEKNPEFHSLLLTKALLDTENERIIQRLARILAPIMPLPELPR